MLNSRSWLHLDKTRNSIWVSSFVFTRNKTQAFINKFLLLIINKIALFSYVHRSIVHTELFYFLVVILIIINNYQFSDVFLYKCIIVYTLLFYFSTRYEVSKSPRSELGFWWVSKFVIVIVMNKSVLIA